MSPTALAAWTRELFVEQCTKTKSLQRKSFNSNHVSVAPAGINQASARQRRTKPGMQSKLALSFDVEPPPATNVKR